MKTPCFAFCFLAFLMTALAGRFIPPYDDSKPPTLTISSAYEQATAALGSETNALHCVGARLSTDFSLDGGWEFKFASTNKPPKLKYVTVDFDNKTYIHYAQGQFQ